MPPAKAGVPRGKVVAKYAARSFPEGLVDGRDPPQASIVRHEPAFKTSQVVWRRRLLARTRIRREKRKYAVVEPPPVTPFRLPRDAFEAEPQAADDPQ